MPFTPPAEDDLVDSGFTPPSESDLIDPVPKLERRERIKKEIEAKSNVISPVGAAIANIAGSDLAQGTVENLSRPVRTLANFPTVLGNVLFGRQDKVPLPPGYNPFRIEVPPDANIRPSLRPYAEGAAEVASSVTDPDVLATLPAVEAKVLGVPSLLGKAYVASMATQIPRGAQDLKQLMEDPNVPPDEKKKAATEYALLVGGTVLGAKGSTIDRTAPKFEIPKEVQESAAVLPKAAEEISKVEPKPTTTEVSDAGSQQKTAEVHGDLQPQPVEGQGKVPAAESRGGVQPPTEKAQGEVLLKPAIKVGEKIYPAEGLETKHIEIETRVKAGPQPDLTGLEEGFVDSQGNFKGRIPAAKETGLPTGTEPGKLHSSDLPENKGGAESTLTPEQQAVSRANNSRAAFEALAKQKGGTPLPEAPKPVPFKTAKMERPPDLIDYILENLGSIKNKSKTKPGAEDYYGDNYKEVRAYNPSSGGKSLWSDTGRTPDLIVQGLIDDGIVSKDFTVDDLYEAFSKIRSQRRAWLSGSLPEQKLDKFWEAIDTAKIGSKSQKISVGELSVGDKFTVQGEPFEVRSIDADTGDIEVQDGRKFGSQTIPDGADIKIDKGSHDTIPVSTEFVPSEKTTSIPKLGQGEKQGDLISSTQSEPLALVGEKGTDFERAQDAKVKAEKDAADAKSLQEKQQQGFQGMGGAVPSEYEASPQTPTGIKNATVDKERASRGLPPAVEPARKSFGQVWDQAMARIDRDPASQDKLINELRDKPRALTDEEDAMLLHRQIDLQNEYGKATRDLAQAYEDGRTEDIESAKYRVASFSDQLLELYNIGKEAGTETGRGLNARKMMANEDFSLASMEIQKRAAKGGAPLTDQERAQLEDLQKRITATQKAYDDYVASSEQRLAEATTQKTIAEAKLEAARKGVPSHIRVLADKILNVVDAEADAARARIKARSGQLFAGVDPTVLYDVSVIGASHILHGADTFASWSAKMVEDFSDRIKPHLDEIWKASNKQIDSQAEQVAGKKNAKPAVKSARGTTPQERIDATENSISARIAAGKRNEISPMVQKLARLLVQRGVTDMQQLIGAVHAILQKADPSFTRREAMDAISGYGQFTALTKDQISVQLRDLKGQMQQTAKLLDMFQGKAPSKTGFERRTPSDTERRQIQQVNEAKKRFGIQTTDPATQLKSSLAALKTRLKNQISDLEEQLAAKTKFVKERAPVPEDAETTALRSRRDALKSDFDQMFGKAEMSDEQRVKIALASLERQAAEVERQLKEGDIFSVKKQPKTPSTPKIEAARAKLDALKTEREYLRESIQPTERMTPEERSLAALKTRLKNRTAELLDKLAKGDFSTKPKRTTQLDAEAMRLKAANEKAKRDFQDGLLRDRLANRSKLEKARDTMLNWSRGFLLSAPTVLAKLTSAAVIRLVTTPMEELVGSGLSKAFPRIAEKAPRQSGMNIRAEARALTEAVTSGMRDAWNTLKTGESELDLAYGKIRPRDRSIIDFFGHIHGALKAPVKRAEFARSFEKRSANAIANVVDVSDPAVQVRLGVEAYKDSLRSIFLQDNRVVKAYRAGIATLKATDKATGTKSLGGEALATSIEAALPIVKVPTNIVGEIMETAVGSVTGSARLAKAYRRGIENLKPEEADIILRQLKKGSLGAAVMALGFFTAESVGGFYQQNQRRPESDVQPKELKVGDVTIPSLYLHAPLPEALQIGATIRRVADSKLRKRDADTQGIPAGLMAGAFGVIEEVPFVKEMLELEKLFAPNQRGQYATELARARLVPQLLQQIAQYTDKDEFGNPIKRKPETIWEGIKTGIPGLRQTVPENRKQ